MCDNKTNFPRISFNLMASTLFSSVVIIMMSSPPTKKKKLCDCQTTLFETSNCGQPGASVSSKSQEKQIGVDEPKSSSRLAPIKLTKTNCTSIKMVKLICRDAMKKERNEGRDIMSPDVT